MEIAVGLILFSIYSLLVIIFIQISKKSKELKKFINETISKTNEDVMGDLIENKSEIIKLLVKDTKEGKEKNTKRSESAKRMWAERKANKKAAKQDAEQP